MTIRYYIVCRDRLSRTVSKSDLTGELVTFYYANIAHDCAAKLNRKCHLLGVSYCAVDVGEDD